MMSLFLYTLVLHCLNSMSGSMHGFFPSELRHQCSTSAAVGIGREATKDCVTGMKT